jgi:cytochrome c oxidase subunit 4
MDEAYANPSESGEPMRQIEEPHILSYGKLVAVWLALLVLTALTVIVSRLDIGIGHVWGSLAIAALKGGLVIAFFMHMRYEGRLLRGLLFLALVTLAIFIGFTFFDVLYR